MSEPTYKVFISYRRSSSEHAANAVLATLEARLGPGSTFLDKSDLEAGASWSAGLEAALASPHLRCFVLIVAPDLWTEPGPAGTPRIWEPHDVLVREIQGAVRRWRADPESFRLILALTDRESRLPSTEERLDPAAPTSVRELLDALVEPHVDHTTRLSDPQGLEALAGVVERGLLATGAISQRLVMTVQQVAALSGEDRAALRENCEMSRKRNDDLRTLTLLALLDIRAHRFDSASSLLRSVDPIELGGALPDGDVNDRYWQAMAHLAVTLAALDGARPRRLRNLKAARVLVTGHLVPALNLFAGLLEVDETAPPGHPTRANAVDGVIATMAVLSGIQHDYFEGRGVLVRPSVHEDRALRDEIRMLEGSLHGITGRAALQSAGMLATWPEPPTVEDPRTITEGGR